MKKSDSTGLAPSHSTPMHQQSLAQMVIALEEEETLNAEDMAAIWAEELHQPLHLQGQHFTTLPEALKSPADHPHILHQILQYAEANVGNPKRLFPEEIYRAMITLIQLALTSVPENAVAPPLLKQDARALLEMTWLNTATREWMASCLKTIEYGERNNV